MVYCLLTDQLKFSDLNLEDGDVLQFCPIELESESSVRIEVNNVNIPIQSEHFLGQKIDFYNSDGLYYL